MHTSAEQQKIEQRKRGGKCINVRVGVWYTEHLHMCTNFRHPY